MPKYAIYDAEGTIIQVMIVDEDHIEQQLQAGQSYLEAADVETHDSVDTVTHTLVKGTAPVIPRNPAPPVLPEYVSQRQQLYPPAEVQLDMLWHAMDDGLITKVPAFYETIKSIKDAVPKDVISDPTIIYTVEPIPEE